MGTASVKMCLFKNYWFLLFVITSHCYALTCRSERGKKEEEIRRVFNDCKKQMNNNSSNSAEDSRNRGNNQWNQWEYNENRDGRAEKKNVMGNRNSGTGNRERNDGGANERYDKIPNRYGDDRNVAERLDDRMNKMNNRNEGSYINGYDTDSGRNRNDMNNYNGHDLINGRNDFLHSEELSGQNNYYPPPQSSRRYKREKRVEMNSGQRSQYNPHSPKSRNHDSNSNYSVNSSKEVERACVLHCVFENLHVTDDNGMPDRYLMTHSFTKDKINEDVRDFVQESIEECYQLAENENTEDKCEFSMNLMTCFVEKERSNCDDFSEMNGFLLE